MCGGGEGGREGWEITSCVVLGRVLMYMLVIPGRGGGGGGGGGV